MTYVSGKYMPAPWAAAPHYTIEYRDGKYWVVNHSTGLVEYITDSLTDAQNYAVNQLPSGNGFIMVKDQVSSYLLMYSGGVITTKIGYDSVVPTTIQTDSSNTAVLKLRSHDGVSYVDNIVLQGGYTKINKVSYIYGDVNGGAYIRFWNYGTEIYFKLGSKTYFQSATGGYYYEATNSGAPAFVMYVKDSAGTYLSRLVVTDDADIVDIRITNAYLDFNDQTLAPTAGTLAGYFIVKVGGAQYKVPAYNLS